MTRVTVRAPATSANLGPGFDCLGMALDLHNTVTLELTPADDATRHPRIIVRGEGGDRLPRDGRNLTLRAVERILSAAGDGRVVARLEIDNTIPVGGGLGSSASAIAGGMAAANALLPAPFSREELLRLALDLEPHPDNLAPAFYGGFTVAVLDDEARPLVAALPPPAGLSAVVLTPAQTVSTHQSRAALPRTVAHADAAYTVGRAALLVSALLTGRHDLLREGMRDRLHQPYRAPAIAAMPEAIAAALDAGASGAALSGSGPSILALCAGPSAPVAAAMAAAAERVGVAARVRELAITPTGAYVVGA